MLSLGKTGTSVNDHTLSFFLIYSISLFWIRTYNFSFFLLSTCQNIRAHARVYASFQQRDMEMEQCFSQLKKHKDREIDGIIHRYNNLNSRTLQLHITIKKRER